MNENFSGQGINEQITVKANELIVLLKQYNCGGDKIHTRNKAICYLQLGISRQMFKACEKLCVIVEKTLNNGDFLTLREYMSGW